MRNIIAFSAFLLLVCVAVAKGMHLNQVDSPAKEKVMNVVIDSIDCRADLCRVYCRALGRPNTSHRIDGVKFAAPGITPLAATDIDPIYFERAFQWEEDGVQPLEIDFPALNARPTNFSLEFVTPYGPVKAAFSAR